MEGHNTRPIVSCLPKIPITLEGEMSATLKLLGIPTKPNLSLLPLVRGHTCIFWRSFTIESAMMHFLDMFSVDSFVWPCHVILIDEILKAFSASSPLHKIFFSTVLMTFINSVRVSSGATFCCGSHTESQTRVIYTYR